MERLGSAGGFRIGRFAAKANRLVAKGEGAHRPVTPTRHSRESGNPVTLEPAPRPRSAVALDSRLRGNDGRDDDTGYRC
jgi:hypothetical protein